MAPLHRTRFASRGLLALAALWAGCAAAVASPDEDVQRAEASLRGGDVFAAISQLRKAADRNNGLAQARLADLLRAAEFDQEALILYRKAAQQGEAAGEFGLGKMYADGVGVPRDAALALEWYRKAEARNHAPALDALARAHRTGDLGLTRDPELAARLDARARELLQQQGRESK